jgi:AcrR family transcriptional regulator
VTVRTADRREAILQAATELVAEGGLDGFSMDDVATRAGVGKATIYRNWRSRGELLVELCSATADQVPVPDNGNLRDDLIEMLGHLRAHLASPTGGPVIAALVEGAEHDPELRRLRAAASKRRREGIRTVIERSQARGEIDATVDSGLLAELLVAPLFYRRFVSRGAVDSAFVSHVVDTVLRATLR